ncbi:MAG: OsmC family protein [Flavobacteriales bacterium]|nr:OsmC family protein [Flavobacteriales bacterium]
MGELRVEATHERSGQRIHTDAPPDNHGRGEAFSPTDLLCTSLACCMITVMGIEAERTKIPLTRANALITKHMRSNPRRVGKIQVDLEIEGVGLTVEQRDALERAALTCPVALSLHPDLEQEVLFSYT